MTGVPQAGNPEAQAIGCWWEGRSDALEGAACHIATVGCLVCLSGICAQAPPEVVGCDAGEVNVIVP